MAHDDENEITIKMSPEVAERRKRASERSAGMTQAAVKEGQLENLDYDEKGNEIEGGQRGVRFRGTIPAPMQPYKMAKEEALAIAEQLTARVQKERARQNGRLAEYHEGLVYYVECHFVWCGGPAIWIKGDPSKPLTEDNWWSAYKPIGAYWSPERRPHCQVCEARQRSEGVKRPAREELKGVDFVTEGYIGQEVRTAITTKPRYVKSITQEDYDEIMTALRQGAAQATP